MWIELTSISGKKMTVNMGLVRWFHEEDGVTRLSFIGQHIGAILEVKESPETIRDWLRPYERVQA